MSSSIDHKRKSFAASICFYFFILTHVANAQANIPVGSWRLHLSYNDIKNVEVTPGKIFAASESGILIFQREEKTLNTYNKLSGLSSTDITSLKFDEHLNQLLVGYSDGSLDILQPGTIINFRRLKDADVTTSKKINDISIREDLAYLSTAFGVVVFDLQRPEIRETWRDLGPSGGQLTVLRSVFLNDSIFLATANGVLAGNLRDNLLDYNNWKRFDTGNLSGPIESIAVFNNKIYAAGPKGIYRFGTDAWVQEAFLDTLKIQSLTASGDHLLMVSDSTIWSVNSSGQLSEISDALLKAPAVVKQDENGDIWVGDRLSGLVSNTGGTFSSYLPDGPSQTKVHRMVYDNGKIYVLAGGFSPSGEALKIPGDLNIFEDGKWTTQIQPARDLTDIAFSGTRTFISSFGSGIAVTDASGNTSFLDETNSPLIHATAGQSDITALEASADGLWVANYGGSQSLHLLKSDGTWNSFSFNFPNAQNPTDLSVDKGGNVWMALNYASGGGLVVWERASNRGLDKTNVPGKGDLPDVNVRCIATDRDGYTWVGTNSGVAYFYTATGDAIKPIYENRFLLRDEKITALEVDAGNRKWIGTEEGAWLFSPTGEFLVHHFTTENSPLLSDIIHDIEINSETGEVFFATDQGIVSFRSDAVVAAPDIGKLKIFPNPVSPGFSGTVAITGLTDHASVRITDIGGKLIWQTQANGGMATWNARDHRGNRVATGIYLVFAAREDGRESVVGKIAVIE